MHLIPPTHGRAGASLSYSHQALAAERTTFAQIENRLAADLDRVFRDEFGVSPHPDWHVAVERIEDSALQQTTFRQAVEAPVRSRQILLEDTGRTVDLQVPVSVQSRIPIVSSPYRSMETDPFDRPERYRTFKGWDAETGLMVFGRAA